MKMPRAYELLNPALHGEPFPAISVLRHWLWPKQPPPPHLLAVTILCLRTRHAMAYLTPNVQTKIKNSPNDLLFRPQNQNQMLKAKLKAGSLHATKAFGGEEL
jgi:hypothetical protein